MKEMRSERKKRRVFLYEAYDTELHLDTTEETDIIKSGQCLLQAST